MPTSSADQIVDVTLTPDLLLTLLPSLRDNRAVRIQHVTKLRGSMLRGEWKPKMNDALTFIGSPGDPDFECKNGQHRLHAYKAALEEQPDLTIEVSIRFNADVAATQVMDIGAPRSLADTLDFLEGRNTAHQNLATVARLAWHVDHGSYLARLPTPSRIQELDFIDTHRDDLIPSVELGKQMRARLHGPLAGYGVACWLINRGDHAELLDNFVDRVAKGENLRGVDPEYRVREQLRDAAIIAGEARPDHRRGWFYTGVLIKAWNDVVNRKDAPQRPYGITRKEGIPAAL